MNSEGVAASVIPCQGGVAILNREFSITGGTGNYTGFIWRRPSDGLYVVTCNPDCSPISGYRAMNNNTYSTLTITDVATTDAGTWRTLDAVAEDAVPVSVCHLTVMKIPRCSISSDVDTDSLEPGTQLTLTVDITGYYCSVETGFDLTTGDVTEPLGMRHNVSDVTDSVYDKTFNTGLRHLGNVTLNFICDTNKTLTCNGVQKLLEKGNATTATATTAAAPTPTAAAPPTTAAAPPTTTRQSSSARSPPVFEDPNRDITLGIAIGFSLLDIHSATINMPRLTEQQRNNAIGRLQAGHTQQQVARAMGVTRLTITNLWRR
ncbi:uncharacterized protein [Haliotis asinina]|uniref:uncharacterized protein n=1 Tax=Haliotis asinina TaxID=109174 RepID=UPI0035325EE7